MKAMRDFLPGPAGLPPDGAYLRVLHPCGGPRRPAGSADAPSGAAEAGAPDSFPRAGDAGDSDFGLLPGDLLFFDLETLGFLGHPVFLIGLLRRSEPAGDWCTIQLLARDYTEEEAILHAFCEECGTAGRWVSFNGKSFDLPFLRRRAAFHRIRLPAPAEHLDLLHLARRQYRGVLPNCRLQTLEDRVLRRARARDLPGAEIPSAYHDYVRTGDATAMELILEHNRYDLMTLARLFLHLESGEDAEGPACGAPREPEEKEDAQP